MTDTVNKPLILIVEDEQALVTLLQYNLAAAGYRTAVSADGTEGAELVAKLAPDLVILDWMLPGMDGIAVCREIRRRPVSRDLPVLMLTARAEEADKVRGLNVGADDYLTKPFSLPELLARVRALLRRAPPVAQKGSLAFADLSVDLAGRRVTRAGRAVHLGPTEFRLLQVLVQAPERVFSREDLLAAVWGADIHVEPRTVDVHVRRLRQALNGDDLPDLIRTVRGGGYGLQEAG
ncbi:MAG: phosphate regulon transcriptional regulator PhoB [Solirubrobacterales bacterium]